MSIPSISLNHEPTTCYKYASRNWEVYFINANKERFEGTVRSIDFVTGKRTSVNVEVIEDEVPRIVSVRNGSFESNTFRAK